MFAKLIYVSRTLRQLLVPTFLFLSSGISPLHAGLDTCTLIIPLVPGETWRDPGGLVGDSTCIDLVLDTAGILMADTSVSAGSPRVSLMIGDVSENLDGNASRATMLQQAASSLIIASGSANYRLRVVAEDSQNRLPPFTLRTRFSARLTKSETNGEIEVDPDPFADQVCPTDFRVDATQSEINGEIEVDPFVDLAFPTALRVYATKSETNGEIEVDPDPFADRARDAHAVSATSELLSQSLAELCRQGEIDDHGDTFACATQIHQRQQATGEIRNSHGDDVDFFRFEVEALGSVEIQVLGTDQLSVDLYDRFGQHLEGSLGDDLDLRLARTLAPGWYFGRVAGLSGGTGSYTLMVGHATQGQ